MRVWLPIIGYDGYYEVSDCGKVYSIRRDILMKKSVNNRGYPVITLRKNGVSKQYTIHSLVCIAFHGPRPTGKEVNHKNGIKIDCREGNLEWMTKSENHKHRFEVLGHMMSSGESHYLHGRFGEHNPAAKELILIDPNGDRVKVKGIAEFCRSNELDRANLYRVISGERQHHKGWHV